MKILLIEPGEEALRECFLAGFKKIKNLELVVASGLNPGHQNLWFEKYTDTFITFQYSDFNSLKDQIINLSIDGVVTFYDLCLEFANKICLELGLKRIYGGDISPSLKSFQRKSLAANAVRSAKFVEVHEISENSLNAASAIGFPCVVKPSQFTSSLGVSIVKNRNELSDALLKAMCIDIHDEKVRDLIPGISSNAIVEEYLTGEEISAEGYVYDGKYHLLGLTQKLRSGQVHLDELGHIFPHPRLYSDKLLYNTVSMYLSQVHSAIGIENSVTHSELKLNSLGIPTLIEVNCRSGGGLISELLELSGCVNIPALMVSIATGQELPKIQLESLTSHSTLFICTDLEGELLVDCAQIAAARLNNIQSYRPLKKRGDILLKLDHNEVTTCGIALVPYGHQALELLGSECIRKIHPFNDLEYFNKLNISLKRRLHECGIDCIFVDATRANCLTNDELESAILGAKKYFGNEIDSLSITLNSISTQNIDALLKIGFAIDGYEYQFDRNFIEKLRESNKHLLPTEYTIQELNLAVDKDELVALEKTAHSADSSSRVNFDSPEALQGMLGYYEKISAKGNAFKLVKNNLIVGTIGFMPCENQKNELQISSFSIATNSQGQGLFFPFLIECLSLEKYKTFQLFSGMTTTDRLISAAKKYSTRPTSVSMSRMAAIS